MAMDFRKAGPELRIEPEKVSGTRIFIPPRLQSFARVLTDGILNRSQLGIYGSFGALFHGLPGTGKSLFARYIAEKSDALLFTAPMFSDPGQVSQLFEDARLAAKDKPVAVLMEDLDYIGKRSDTTNTGFRAVLAQLLTEFDMSRQNNGIFRVITSNLPDNLDEALRRPPRITFEHEFLPPTYAGRKEILKAMLSNQATNLQWSDEVIDYAASITFGYTPGDLVGIVQCAAIHAVQNNRNPSNEDVLNAKMLIKPSAIRDMPCIEPTERLEQVSGGYISQAKEMLTQLALRIDNGILLTLYGPSGCGKTFLAKALAGSSGFNTILLDSSHIVDKYVGESGKAVARAFQRAEALAPCVLIIDQAEGIINPANPYADEWLSVLKAKLSKPIPGVFVVLTTTNPSYWGEEILGRFHNVYVSAPDNRSLRDIFVGLLPEGHQVDVDSVLQRAGSERLLTPRMVRTAITSIEDFGAEVTADTLVRVLQAMKAPTSDIPYEQLSQKIGNNAEIFGAIRGDT